MGQGRNRAGHGGTTIEGTVNERERERDRGHALVPSGGVRYGDGQGRAAAPRGGRRSGKGRERNGRRGKDRLRAGPPRVAVHESRKTKKWNGVAR